MSNRITAVMPVGSLLDLKYEWRVIAFRPNNEGEWRWNIEPTEIRTFREMVDAGNIVSVHRRDSDGTRLLAQLRRQKK
jgi:hypothetical protein